MASTTILSDNGVSSGTAGIKTTGGNDGTLQLQTTTAGGAATTAMTIDTSQKVSFTNPIQGGSITSGTAIASTSGTSIDFTSIPSWVKRITVMFNGVSTNGTANFFLQLGSGSPTTSGYLGATGYVQNAGASTTMINNSGLGVIGGGGNVVLQGAAVFSLLNSVSNTWVGTHAISRSDAAIPQFGSTAISLSGVLDRVRITTSNGTDTFDAGSINILYEG